MKRCLTCGDCSPRSEWPCPSCGAVPACRDGFLTFAPDLAEANDHFNPSFFRELAVLEDTNYWFRSRNALIIWALSRYFPGAARGLEIGCGTGYVLSALEKRFPEIRFVGSEIFVEGLVLARQRVTGAELIQMNALSIPYREEFDVVGCFDVLEHIGEDATALREICHALKRGGGVILTVPQHMFLWSRYDSEACHVRRYSRRELTEKVSSAGFKVVWTTSFVGFLLPAMLASRYLRRNHEDGDFDELQELRVGRVTNRLLEMVLDAERGVIRAGVSLPLGGSLMMVAVKE